MLVCLIILHRSAPHGLTKVAKGAGCCILYMNRRVSELCRCKTEEVDTDDMSKQRGLNLN